MARNIFKQLIKFLPFITVFLFILLLIGGSVITLFINTKREAIENIFSDGHVKYVIFFTIYQSVISTILVIALSILVGLALHRRTEFFGRKFLVNSLSVAFVLPSIVIVLGLVVLHGKNGWVNKVLGNFDLTLGHYLYGMFGILVGHIAFNLPLGVRIVLNQLDSIPSETWKLVSQLGLNSLQIFRIVEFPILRSSIAGMGSVIFMMCFSSFVIVLALGGGPMITTVEVEIYRALKFDFDLSKAVALSTVQIGISLSLIYFTSRFSFHSLYAAPKRKYFLRPDKKEILTKIQDTIALSIAIITVIMPIIAVVYSGLDFRYIELIYSYEFWHSFRTSIFIALSSGLTSLVLSFSIISGCYYIKYKFHKPMLALTISKVGNLTLITPPFIFATGLFLIMNNFSNIYNLAPQLIILTNAIMTLPFMLSILFYASMGVSKNEVWLSESLGIRGWDFFRLIFWHQIRKATGFGFALSCALSWGDMGVIAMFGNKDLVTLPFLMYQKLSSYRIGESAIIALFLVFISMLIFWIIEEIFSDEDMDARY